MLYMITSFISIMLFGLVQSCRSNSYSAPIRTAASDATIPNDATEAVDEASNAPDIATTARDQTRPASDPIANPKLPPAPDNYCRALAIVGGTPATINDMVTRSTVQLVIGQGTCTGALIGPNQISTAAHCVESNPAAQSIQILFGIKPTPNPNIRVKGYAVHPNYIGLAIGPNGYPARRLFDVAVISFDGKIPAGFGIAPVGSTAKLAAGAEVTVAGFGAYSEKDMVARPLTFVKKQVALFDRDYKEIQLQVGGGTGACYGDSGGPSYVLSDNGMCLNTLSTTTGPGRASNGICDQGHGTLMDITAHQGWMSCAFDKLGTPLAYLLKDETKEICDRTIAK